MIASLSTQYEHAPARLDLSALVEPEAVAPADPHADNRALLSDVSTELCQLVTDYDPKHLPAHGVIVERKHDGWRALWLRGELVSRGGATLWSTAHLWPALRELEARFGEPMMFDGEYVVMGSFARTSDECSRFKNAGVPISGYGVLHLFDAVPMSVWEGRERGRRLAFRTYMLGLELKNLRGAGVKCPGLLYVRPKVAAFDSTVQDLARAAFDAGHEGVVAKDPRSLHVAGSSRAWMRLKRSLTLDLRVIGYGEGKGKNAGVLGHIVCDLDGKAVKVGIGFDDRERAVLWHHPEKLVGRIAEIGAMEILDSGALRQAKFLRWREDKA